MKNSHIIKRFILLILIIIVLIGIWKLAVRSHFSGTIEAYNSGCAIDLSCSMTIDGKIIITQVGWRGGAQGRVIGNKIEDVEFGVTEADVYARKKLDGTYTLYGSNNYYIKIK